MFSFKAGEQRVAQCLLAWFVGKRPVAFVGDLEHVLGAFAEGGEARVMHAQALLAQDAGDVGKQSGAVGGHQAQQGARAVFGSVERDLRHQAEMAQVARLGAARRAHRIQVALGQRSQQGVFDGRGIHRERVRGIAVSKGLIAEDAALTDDEIDNLIFLPGFSTASTVSDISGRGVGMDVVKRSIQSLGGRISISSSPGKGSTFTLSLPLTLAVLDGMVLGAADQTLVAPLSAIVESLTPKAEDVHYVGGHDAVIRFREAFVPLRHRVGLARD